MVLERFLGSARRAPYTRANTQEKNNKKTTTTMTSKDSDNDDKRHKH
jgi:hypothetical protein